MGLATGLLGLAIFDRYAGADRALDTLCRKYGEAAVVRAAFPGNGLPVLGGGLARERRTGITAGISLEREWEAPVSGE